MVSLWAQKEGANAPSFRSQLILDCFNDPLVYTQSVTLRSLLNRRLQIGGHNQGYTRVSVFVGFIPAPISLFPCFGIFCRHLITPKTYTYYIHFACTCASVQNAQIARLFFGHLFAALPVDNVLAQVYHKAIPNSATKENAPADVPASTEASHHTKH
jgi:hypothetical protein